MNNKINIYKSPYGFEIMLSHAFSPENEKVIFEEILQYVHKGNRFIEIQRNLGHRIDGHDTHFRALYTAAIQQYKKDIDCSSQIDWEANRERLYEVYNKAVAANDRKSAISALKEINRMIEFCKLSEKADAGDTEYQINFQI